MNYHVVLVEEDHNTTVTSFGSRELLEAYLREVHAASKERPDDDVRVFVFFGHRCRIGGSPRAVTYPDGVPAVFGEAPSPPEEDDETSLLEPHLRK